MTKTGVLLLGVVAVAMAGSSVAFAQAPPAPAAISEQDRQALMEEDREAGHVVALFAPHLMKIPGVWGVQDYLQPDGHIGIRVDVEKITPEIEREVPKRLGKFRVVIFVGPRPVLLGEDQCGPSCAGATKPGPAAPK